MIVRTASIPMDWKKAKISLIPKDGDLTDINNFRPIAILPVVSKILEHLVHSQTMSYLEENNIWDVNQGGFRKNNSTTATTSSMPDIYKNINNQQTTYSIFIDFRKAFDSINHSILLSKLSKLGFQEYTLNWFKNYLTGRTQYTVVNGLIYKCTILPVLEYADFVQDQNINYTNKALQKLQNSGLSIAHDQHI